MKMEKNVRNEKLHKLCSSPRIIKVMKSRKMEWAIHIARMGR
jgi:hypothetical protein